MNESKDLEINKEKVVQTNFKPWVPGSTKKKTVAVQISDEVHAKLCEIAEYDERPKGYYLKRGLNQLIDWRFNQMRKEKAAKVAKEEAAKEEAAEEAAEVAVEEAVEAVIERDTPF